MTDGNSRDGCTWRWAASICVAVVSSALAFGCSALTAVGIPPPFPGPCEVVEYTTGYAKPVGRTVYGWAGGQRAWRQENLRDLPATASVLWSGPREDYTYFDDGTMLVPTHGNGEFSLHAPRGPIDHVWRLYASTMEDARSLYTVDTEGRVTSVQTLSEPRYTYSLDSAGRAQAVKVQCGGSMRSVQWLRNPDGKVREVLIDMGSGLTDTRLVYELEGGQKKRARVLRRGQGRTAASAYMVYECTPWLGAGRGVYETPAPAEVRTFIELGRTDYSYDANGHLTREASTHVTALDQTRVHRFDRDGNRIQTDLESDGTPERTTRYTYDCWR